jgi:hypothetical protein
MKKLSESFIRKVAHCLMEEETDLYVLRLHENNHKGMEFFPTEDRKRIEEIFSTLREDTKRHAGVLELICELSEGATS